MTQTAPILADAPSDLSEVREQHSLPIPRYLEAVYWWAYVHPRAVHLFEREWLVNLILFGNYGRLRDAAHWPNSALRFMAVRCRSRASTAT